METMSTRRVQFIGYKKLKRFIVDYKQQRISFEYEQFKKDNIKVKDLEIPEITKDTDFDKTAEEIAGKDRLITQSRKTELKRLLERILVANNDNNNFSVLNEFKGHIEAVTGICVMVNGDKFVSASQDNTCKIWDLTTGEEITTLQGHEHAVSAIAVSPNGEIIASGSHDNTCKLWNIERGECSHTLTGHTDHIGYNAAMTFNPHGDQVAFGGPDNNISIHEVKTGR
uniref:Dynein assembly factor with WDR repeat domains 1-like n=1 Tax=Saccoglossus kowalevskii TaxID=10224 RepID=A0ABM0MLE2_SACKO|nr:PREDICTED: dynein assembly factor with WDR repeat domains 1-like [Saccoglossus kowalevskii]